MTEKKTQAKKATPTGKVSVEYKDGATKVIGPNAEKGPKA